MIETSTKPNTLAGRARDIVALSDPHQKAEASRAAARDWWDGALQRSGCVPDMPDMPGRLDRPALLHPAAMPKRSFRSEKGRVALLHALAHIELNAINLAWDMVARFAGEVSEKAFFDDWVRVGDDEARHFQLLAGRLQDFGAAYGDLPAHDGLWEAAYDTRHDLLARLAVVPTVLEARGLDVCPDMITRLKTAQDTRSVEILTVIYEDEIDHVRVGMTWFQHLCHARSLPVRETWQCLVRKHFKGQLKPPFNEQARASAGLPQDFYAPLS